MVNWQLDEFSSLAVPACGRVAQIARLAALMATITLSACGGGEQSPPPQASEPLAMAEAPPAPIVDLAPGPPSLPAPALAQAPAQSGPLPGPPPDGPPLRIGQREDAIDRPVPGVRWQVVAKELSEPWDLAASSDGNLFYTERTKGLSVLRPDGSRHLVFAPADLWSAGQGGMFGVAVDPSFARTRRVFVVMTAKSGEHADTRVVRLTLDARLQQITERKDIVSGIAMPDVALGRSGEAVHTGGSLRFGGEQLYVGLGDARSASGPQSPILLHGKVLRVDRDGNASSGNRPPNGYDARVFAYGFKNPVALAVNPRTKDLIVVESSPGQADAIVQAAPGGNGGWDPRCAGAGVSSCAAANVGGVLPAWRSGTAYEGLSSAGFVSGQFLWDWNGALAVAFNEGRRIDLLKVDHAGKVVRRGTLLRQAAAGFRAIAQSQQDVYVVTSGKAGGDEIWRLTFQ